MNQDALRVVIGNIERAIALFAELDRADAALAFSGGKDSIALAYALKAMGRLVSLRAVDMGYSREWRDRILAIAAHLDLPLEVHVVKSIMIDDQLDADARQDLLRRRTFLDSPAAAGPTVTPCTNCYNCKIISLVHGGSGHLPILYFAHHATDSLASFLKSALMFHDRWARGNSIFDRHRFRGLAQLVAEDLRGGRSEYLKIFRAYLEDGSAHTSEPPLERRYLHGVDYVIGRPLFFVAEETTAELAASLCVRTESSGCGHSISSKTMTPREIVHREMLPAIAETPQGHLNLQKLQEAIKGRLNTDGTAQADVRTSRHILLGSTYKGRPEQLADRL
jgi:hypothetical protein